MVRFQQGLYHLARDTSTRTCAAIQTLLDIIIGVGAVIAMVSIGQGAQATIFGGILGVAGGAGASKLISDSLGWPTLVSSAAIGMAFTFAGAIGIAAGWYPALKASRLDPIEALRYE